MSGSLISGIVDTRARDEILRLRSRLRELQTRASSSSVVASSVGGGRFVGSFPGIPATQLGGKSAFGLR